jgi:hypothetical protein
VTDWQIEGEWFKNCNCDPGCPCGFNQRPTQGHCEGLAAMRITKGHFGDVDLTGVKWGGVVRWPGALHEGNGELMPFVDSSASEEQINAIFEIASGKHGDTFMEVFSFICPTIHEPVIAPVEWEFDLESRSGRIRVGDGVVESTVETLRGISPPEPYRILVRIPDGMEYTGPNEGRKRRSRPGSSRTGRSSTRSRTGTARWRSSGTAATSARASTIRSSSTRRSIDRR